MLKSKAFVMCNTVDRNMKLNAKENTLKSLNWHNKKIINIIKLKLQLDEYFIKALGSVHNIYFSKGCHRYFITDSIMNIADVSYNINIYQTIFHKVLTFSVY